MIEIEPMHTLQNRCEILDLFQKLKHMDKYKHFAVISYFNHNLVIHEHRWIWAISPGWTYRDRMLHCDITSFDHICGYCPPKTDRRKPSFFTTLVMLVWTKLNYVNLKMVIYAFSNMSTLGYTWLWIVHECTKIVCGGLLCFNIMYCQYYISSIVDNMNVTFLTRYCDISDII